MASALGVVNIGGIFVVLLCGLALAFVVAILEFCWGSRDCILNVIRLIAQTVVYG